MGRKMSKIKEITNDTLIMFIFIGKKNNQAAAFDADGEILNLWSTDNAGNSVNLVSGIIRLPSGCDFSVCI